MKRLAIITSHPIQYNAPLFKLLASHPEVDVKVFYTLGLSYETMQDKGFGKAIRWDIPLLEGYSYEFLENVSNNPGTFHFKGIINPKIVDRISNFKPSAILVYGWSFASHLKVLRYFKNKVPVFFRGDSTLLDQQKGLRLIARRLLLKWVYSFIDKAFYVGFNNKHYFLKHGVKEEKLVFAPHAVDNNRFGNGAEYLEESKLIRTAMGIPELHTVFLFSGKFEKKKSPLLLIKAFKKLRQKQVSLVFVGNGELENLLKAEAEGESNIHFLPFQNQTRMPAVYRSADVFVLPSGGPGETWGLSVNEAMACGLGIIVSDKVGCAADLVRENSNGYIFDAEDQESLLEKLSLCASKSKAELISMGNASKEIIKDWNFDTIGAAIIKSLPD